MVIIMKNIVKHFLLFILFIIISILNLFLFYYLIISSPLYYLIPYSFTLPIPYSTFINLIIIMLPAPISAPLGMMNLIILLKMIHKDYKIRKDEIKFIAFLFIFSIIYYIFIFDKLLPLPFKIIEDISSQFR